MLISHEALRAVARTVLKAAGSNDEEVAIVADHLIEANLKGHDSHGVGMLPAYVANCKAGRLRPNQHAEFVLAEGPLAVVDGHMGYGQVVAREATGWAVEAAKQHGIALVSVRNAQHIGRVGAYGERVAAAGKIGLFFVNVVSGPPRVAPFRGSDGRTSTNPICVAVPNGAAPIVLDFATSGVALGKVRVALNEGRTLPPGLLVDAQGHPSVDPGVVFSEPRGAVLPFGAHKGSGLALICEILGGALTGTGTIQPATSRERGIVNGMLAIVVEPARLVDLPWFEREVAAVVRHVKGSPPSAPDQPVLLAGEPERLSRQERLVTGISIDDTTWGEIVAAAALVGVASDRLHQLASGQRH